VWAQSNSRDRGGEARGHLEKERICYVGLLVRTHTKSSPDCDADSSDDIRNRQAFLLCSEKQYTPFSRVNHVLFAQETLNNSERNPSLSITKETQPPEATLPLNRNYMTTLFQPFQPFPNLHRKTTKKGENDKNSNLNRRRRSFFVVVGLVVRAAEFELRFVATAIHYAGWDRESSDYVFSEAGMIL
jgi:hypothetical protein